MKAIYPGSFDPLTYGHLDIITRSSKIFEEVYVTVAINITKEYLFDYKERVLMIEECVSHLKNVHVVATNKLVVDFAVDLGVNNIVRGLRAVSDFESELQIATTNLFLNANIETMFFMSKPQHMFLSSSQARELARFKGNLKDFVPQSVETRLRKLYE